MPELPEVEIIRRHLSPIVVGKTLTALDIKDPLWCAPVAPEAVESAVIGRKLESLRRRGKYLLFEFEDDIWLICHLRMTGTLLHVSDEGTRRYLRVRFEFRPPPETLMFLDQRRFGTGEVVNSRAELDDFMSMRLGLEPFDPSLTASTLFTLMQNSRAPIKAFLLDQKRIAGVGNIYADEALFRARIHPLRLANTISSRKAASLLEGVRESLAAGINAEGASIDDFVHPDGEQGRFQDEFLIHQREGKPCLRCGRTIRKTRVGGRGTYFCPNCQRR